MFERFKNNGSAEEPRTRTGSVATTERTGTVDNGRTVDDGRTIDDGGAVGDGRTVGDGRAVDDDRAARGGVATRTDRPVAAGTDMHAVRARQRDEYGGINWGAAFFGWLVAVGVAVLLTGILAAAGAAIGLTQPSTANQAGNSSAETLSVVGAIALLVVLAIAYYCGGYVAGRMSRFDGARQGIGAWVVGLIITILAGVLAAVAGDKYNVVSRANLPRLPIGQDTLTTGGIIATIAILAVTLLFAALGGIAGARYHRKVDRVGFAD